VIEFIIFFISVICCFILFLHLFLHECEELIDGNVLKVAVVGIHEPLEYFFQSILSSLMIGNIITLRGLFEELSEGICRYLKALLKSIQMCSVALSHWRHRMVLLLMSRSLWVEEETWNMLVLHRRFRKQTIFHSYQKLLVNIEQKSLLKLFCD